MAEITQEEKDKVFLAVMEVLAGTGWTVDQAYKEFALVFGMNFYSHAYRATRPLTKEISQKPLSDVL
jgi:hypothetical protein